MLSPELKEIVNSIANAQQDYDNILKMNDAEILRHSIATYSSRFVIPINIINEYLLNYDEALNNQHIINIFNQLKYSLIKRKIELESILN